jgi:hypothetical protein
MIDPQEEAMRAPASGIVTWIVFGLLLGLAQSGMAQSETARLHVRVETQGATGEQVTRFWAYTTTDEAGTNPLEVSRLCVKGVGHRTEEKCVENASTVEVVERATGLTGVGNQCVEAFASATWRTLPLTANARACP